jgi:hypothetical protein
MDAPVNYRGSLYVNAGENTFSYDAPSSPEKNNPKQQVKKIASSTMQNLSLDKISDLNHIFHACNRQNKGVAAFEDIEKCKIN